MLTNNPRFKAWFSNSQVVDAQGLPLVVYHGTKADFQLFDTAKCGSSDEGLAGPGFYFTYNAEEASSYGLRETCGKGDTPNVIPVYLALCNPLLIKAGRLPDGRSLRDIHGGIGITAQGGKKVRMLAEQSGHDGVMWVTADGAVRHAVAWTPFQIKSAIGNGGMFDPLSPNITE